MGIKFLPKQKPNCNHNLPIDLDTKIKRVQEFTNNPYTHLNSNWALENRSEYSIVRTVIINFVHLGLKEALKEPPQQAILSVQEILDRSLSAIEHLKAGSTEFINLILDADLTWKPLGKSRTLILEKLYPTMYLNASIAHPEQVPAGHEIAHKSDQDFDQNDLVMIVVWGLVGFILGLNITAIIAIFAWSVIDTFKKIYLQIQILRHRYSVMNKSNPISESEAQKEPMQMENTFIRAN